MPSLWSRATRGAQQLTGIARASYVTLRHTAHPIEDGELRLEFLDAPVEILRDEAGVPHIFATSEADACFGQGFVHAQDRLFQMDAMRRSAQGRLSEWAGSATLDADRFMRRLGLADIAARDLASAGDSDRELLAAYARGVNEGIRTLPALPPEYAFVGATPEPWHPEHTMLLGRFVLFSFASDWDTELVRERLLTALGPKRAGIVDPTQAAAAYTSTGELSAPAVDRLLGAYEAAVEAGFGTTAASNAWAVTPERSTTGAPLLASDPHLESRMPGLLHMAHIVGGDFDVVGAGVAGIPLVAMGHNRELAWGITAGLADVSDCYLETVDPADPTRYLTPDGWVTGRTRIERIKVRGAETVEERVLETRHGPVIGPALLGETRAIALRSTSLEPGEPLGPVLDICRATTVEEFDAAIARRPGVPFNYVYAHRGGRIGYRMSGGIPAREHGEGLLPRDGATSTGRPRVRPSEEMPHLIDPTEGFVANANNAPGGPFELGDGFAEHWRVERIVALLRARPQHSLETFEAIQLDTYSAALVALRDYFVAAEATGGMETRAIIEAWDGRLTAESAGGAIISTAYQELARILASRAAGSEASILLGSGWGSVGAGSFSYRLQGHLLRKLEAVESPWFLDAEDRTRTLHVAMARALEALQTKLGDSPWAWRWGDLHQWHLPHALSAVPGLGPRLSRGPYPIAGDGNTVFQSGYSVHKGPSAAGILPGYRQLIDLGDFDRSMFQLSTGNSGIPGHPRYGDCIEEYLVGEYRPMHFERDVIDHHAEHSLRLVPA